MNAEKFPPARLPHKFQKGVEQGVVRVGVPMRLRDRDNHAGCGPQRGYPPLWGLRCGVNPLNDRVCFPKLRQGFLFQLLKTVHATPVRLPGCPEPSPSDPSPRKGKGVSRLFLTGFVIEAQHPCFSYDIAPERA